MTSSRTDSEAGLRDQLEVAKRSIETLVKQLCTVETDRDRLRLKLKQTTEKMVLREELEKAVKDLKESQSKGQTYLKENQKMKKDIDHLKLDLMSAKEKVNNLEIMEETKSFQLKMDLLNLGESVKMAKKVTEFESEQH